VKRAALGLLFVALFVFVAIRAGFHRAGPGPVLNRATPSNAMVAVTTIESPAQTQTFSNQSPPFLGQTILRDYANPNRSPENDLTLMSRLMENSLLLLKSAADRPLSANEDWAALFRGRNTAHERFLPDSHVALNANGQLIDRWGTPLFFHAVGGGRFEIRSAGPDKTLWTGDDIHRNSDGHFRRGSELNPPALFNPGGASTSSR
jgi:hypothetical protein